MLLTCGISQTVSQKFLTWLRKWQERLSYMSCIVFICCSPGARNILLTSPASPSSNVCKVLVLSFLALLGWKSILGNSAGPEFHRVCLGDCDSQMPVALHDDFNATDVNVAGEGHVHNFRVVPVHRKSHYPKPFYVACPLHSLSIAQCKISTAALPLEAV